jgi:hypothetical protein
MNERRKVACVMQDAYEQELKRHYAGFWGPGGGIYEWTGARSKPCRVFEFPATEKTICWIYATCGMTPASAGADGGAAESLELFLLSPSQVDAHVELLSAIADYHQTGASLGLGHTVNFGRPWMERSRCSCGLISLPYTLGPKLERAVVAGRNVRVLWLLPITPEERAYKVKAGLEALEDVFEKREIRYADPMRESLVAGDETGK